MGVKVSGTTGRIIPCCWADCDRAGRTEHQIVIREAGSPDGRVPPRNLIYLFCSERHRLYYRNGPSAFGQLRSGERSTDVRVTLPRQKGLRP